jgi:ribA/ribD-fused uncharacterized protein
MENYKVYERIYDTTQVVSFKKTKDAFGGLSNMAAGFPLTVNGVSILTSEALYQACRFPHLPAIQQLILNEKSPMTAKMITKPYRAQSREDFDSVKIDIMRWCLRVKLAQNFITFGKLLKSTQNRPIVEDSHKDTFWGAVRDKTDDKLLHGINVLGRLLMQLRELYVENPYSKNLFYIEPLHIPNFTFLGEPISIVDEREKMINYLIHEFSLHSMVPSNDYPINIQTRYTKSPELMLDVR